jgi:hypothetical protein
VHDDVAAGGGEEVTHFGEADLVAGEDEHVEDEVAGEHALHEPVVVLLGGCKVLDVFALAQLLG